MTADPKRPDRYHSRQIPTCPIKPSWGYWKPVVSIEGRVLVWWHTESPGDEDFARKIAKEIIRKIWPRLVKDDANPQPFADRAEQRLEMSAPLLDPTQACNGSGPELDIYINPASDKLKDRHGVAQPYENTRPISCYIGVVVRGADVFQYVAHEFFHAIVMAYRYDINEYNWLEEATAVWVEDFLYPGGEGLMTARKFLERTEQALDTLGDGFELSASLYFHFMAGPGREQATRIPRIWELAEAEYSKPSLEVIDTIFPFSANWHVFARINTNHPMVTGYNWYKSYLGDREPVWLDVNMASDPRDKQFPLSFGLGHLSAWYFRFRNFNNVNSFVYTYSVKFAPDVSIWAMIKIGGKWREEDWSSHMTRPFCLYEATERIEELRLIISNSNWRRDFATGEVAVEMFYSNIGCRRWSGKTRATLRHVSEGEDWTITADATVVFAIEYEPSHSGQGASIYRVESGSVSYKADGISHGCTVSGEESRALDPGSGSLSVFNWARPDSPDHRKASGLGGGAPFTPTVTCTSPREIRSRIQGPLWFDTGPDQHHEVSSDGMFFTGSHQAATTDETTTWEWSLHADGGPRTTATPTLELDPHKPIAVSGWADGPVAVRLAAASGSNIRELSYSAIGAQPVPTTTVADASTTVHITAEGQTTMSFWATDIDDNVEEVKTLDVLIDRSPPTMTASALPPADPDGWHQSNVTVVLEAADLLSGVASISYSSTGAHTIPPTTVNRGSIPVTIDTEGTTTLTASAVDKVGNKSEPCSWTVNIALPV